MTRRSKIPFYITPDETKMMCLICQKFLPRTTEFFYINNRTGTLRRRCKDCTNIESRKRHAKPKANERHCDRMREKAFGLTKKDYKKIVEEQDNRCAICNQHETRKNRIGQTRNLSVDHCHKSGKIRQLLCSNCNAGLGHFKDNPEFILAAYKYILKHNTESDFDVKVLTTSKI